MQLLQDGGVQPVPEHAVLCHPSRPWKSVQVTNSGGLMNIELNKILLKLEEIQSIYIHDNQQEGKRKTGIGE